MFVLNVHTAGERRTHANEPAALLNSCEHEVLARSDISYELLHVETEAPVDVCAALAAVCSAKAIDLLVLGSYGLSRSDRSEELGSTSRRAAELCPAPMALVVKHTMARPSASAVRMAVCVDGSDLSLEALTNALDFARDGDRVIVVTVATQSDSAADIASRLERCQAVLGTRPALASETLALERSRDTIGKRICAFCVESEIDFVFVGTVGLANSPTRFGSVGKWILLKAACNVVIVRPDPLRQGTSLRAFNKAAAQARHHGDDE